MVCLKGQDFPRCLFEKRQARLAPSNFFPGIHWIFKITDSTLYGPRCLMVIERQFYGLYASSIAEFHNFVGHIYSTLVNMSFSGHHMGSYALFLRGPKNHFARTHSATLVWLFSQLFYLLKAYQRLFFQHKFLWWGRLTDTHKCTKYLLPRQTYSFYYVGRREFCCWLLWSDSLV